MDAPAAEREWQNAQDEDMDRRDARETYVDSSRDYERRSSRDDYDRRRDSYSRPPRDDRGPSHRFDDRGRGDRYASRPPRNNPPVNRPSPPPSNIIGAFGLSIRTTERDLEEEFGRIGEVEKVVIVYDARTGRSRGFGFITMKDVETATEAIKQMNNVDLHGRRIRVDYSSTSRAHDPTPGEYRGNPRPTDDRFARRGGFFRSYDRDYGRYDRGRGYGRYPDSDRRWRDDRGPPRGRSGAGSAGRSRRRRPSTA